jgi:hypothetical protein
MRPSNIIPILFLLTFITPPLSVSAATRVFYDGYESGNTNLWSQGDFRNRCQVVNVAADGGAGPQSGSFMLRCNWNGLVAWNDPASFETLVLDSWPANQETFLRFWIRPDDNAKDHPANGPKIWRMDATEVSGCSFWAMNFITGQTAGAIYSSPCEQIGPTFWGGSDMSTDDGWHKLEFYIKQGAPGIFRYWEDDVLMHEVTNATVFTPGGDWYPFHISSNWSGEEGCCDHDAANYLYWDGFEVYSDDIGGAPTTGLMSDGSITIGTDTPPPAAPSGLGVQ